MATSISDIKDQLINNTKLQKTPITLTDDDYMGLAILGCKRFYIDIGNESNWDSDYSSDTNTLAKTLDIKQKDYCTLASEIEFFKSIRNHWSTMISYTTNALSVAYAYKPFEFIDKIINEKEIRLTDLFHKMPDISNMSSVSDISIDPVDYEYKG